MRGRHFLHAGERIARHAHLVLVTGLAVIGIGMLFYFDAIPPYTAPTWFGVTRPSLAQVPFLCLFVGILYWRVRASERLGRIIALFSILAVVSNVAMLYSQAPADAPAMLAHAARLVNGLFLMFTLVQMGTIDMARRMRAERDLTRTNEALEDRVRARTADLEAANAALRETQQVVLQQERLHALGQMASGIAHDINNAISPATLYVESILARAPGLDARTRSQLETVQRGHRDARGRGALRAHHHGQRERDSRTGRSSSRSATMVSASTKAPAATA